LNKYVRAALWGLGIGYAIQFVIAYSAGYTFRQALIPSEALRLRLMMDPTDPMAVEIAKAAQTATEAEQIVNARMTYQFSADIYGHEAIPSLAEIRAAAVDGKLRGDCKAFAVLLGSVWLAMGVDFKVHTSYDHVWLEARRLKGAASA